MESYKQLEEIFEKAYRFSHFLSLGEWDADVKMPPKGAAARGEALAAVEEYIKELVTSDNVRQYIKEAKSCAELTDVQKANLREMEMVVNREAGVPSELAAEKSRLTTEAKQVWQKARAENDFKTFLPVLKKLVHIAREEAKHRMKHSGASSLYEALFQVYEPGMPLKSVDAIFNDVKTWLPDLIKKVMKKQEGQVVVKPVPPFPKDKQEELSRELMKVWKYDFDAGRLDPSTHPFTGMTKEDTRITTRYSDDILMNIYATIHETGHAKYEQNGGPRDMITQPVCNARSLGIHESQSLFAERMVARDKKFIGFLVPLIEKHLGKQPAFEEKNFAALTQTVKPGYIRVEADEVCYTMHIILRYEMEKALIEGTMEAEDVPRVWNEKMKEYLGIQTLGKDSLGCLQDVHWAMGAIGYFSTYALGAMFAAQLMGTIRKELGSDVVDKAIRTGELDVLLKKQKEKIWDHGSMYLTEELMIKATGEPLNVEHFKKHLMSRYLE